MNALRVGTRASKLALAQTGLVVERLRAAHPALDVETITISTAGDRDQTSSLTSGEGVGWFTTAIQQALAAGEIDVAVHSYKDLPTKRPEGLLIAAVPLREDPRDALVSNNRATLRGLKAGSVVGTSSARREAQMRALRPDLEFRPIRGNVDGRVAKVDSGEFDATVLALAGLSAQAIERRAPWTESAAKRLISRCGMTAAPAIMQSASAMARHDCIRSAGPAGPAPS